LTTADADLPAGLALVLLADAFTDGLLVGFFSSSCTGAVALTVWL
jgi:hypothetical protein